MSLKVQSHSWESHWFDMKTMHFHMAQTDLFLGQLVFAFRGSRLTIRRPCKIVLGCKVGKKATRLILFLWKYNMKRLV